jgi:predicted RNase H-like HicB family nuclease
MSTVKIVYWQDEDFWLGYLQEYPDYMTQGETLEQLKENLKDIYHDIADGYIPSVRKVDELVVS